MADPIEPAPHPLLAWAQELAAGIVHEDRRVRLSATSPSLYVPRDGLLFRTSMCAYQGGSRRRPYRTPVDYRTNDASDQAVAISREDTPGGAMSGTMPWYDVGNGSFLDSGTAVLYPTAHRMPDSMVR